MVFAHVGSNAQGIGEKNMGEAMWAMASAGWVFRKRHCIVQGLALGIASPALMSPKVILIASFSV